MYVGLLNFSGIKDIDSGITFIMQLAVPVVPKQAGQPRSDRAPLDSKPPSRND